MKKFGLIGEKLSHSFSPQIHNLLSDYEYKLYEVEPADLKKFLCGEMADTYPLPSGFNVTIPYKEAVIPFCSELSSRARTLKSVNTIVRKPDGSFSGDNTDYYGFQYLIEQSKISVEGKKILLLGSGGASKTVQGVLNDMNAGKIVVISRKGENTYSNLHLHKDASVIINTTPVGMYPNTGSSPIDLSLFPNCVLVLDLIYNPARTALLLQAEALNIPAFNGLPMLVAQAKKAAEIFSDSSIPDERIEEITSVIRNKTDNIILIGMPGCGKSTIGSALSEKTGRPLIDLDEEIVKKSGCSIPDIFANHGESKFRQIETEITVAISKQSGLIISCGGGIVTQPQNKNLLRQNGTVVLIERPIELLPSDGRPISLSRDIEELYKERKPLYQSWCDLKVKNEGKSPEELADEIISKLI